MSTTPIERLYSLLPTIYHVRDVEQGEPLRALLEVMETQFLALQEDIDTLYDNWFIETCEEWAVPYIGDLLGVRSLKEVANGAFSLRSYIGNTLAYRQAKGTPAILEQLARDVTGWPVRVVEYFQHLAVTQNFNHFRKQVHLVDLRNVVDIHAIGSPFETAMHTAEVRRIVSKRGRYNIQNIGIWVWRIQAYPMLLARAIPNGYAGGDIDGVAAVGDGCYHINPYDIDMQLYNRPQAETDLYHLAEGVNVPDPLDRRTLFEDLEAIRAAALALQQPSPVYFGEQPPFRIYLNEELTLVPFENVYVCNLSTWRRPESGKVAIDPVLGRIAFADDETPDRVYVDYCYGFSADIGGGPYNRRQSLTAGDSTVWTKTVSKRPEDNANYGTLIDALAAWNALSSPRDGIIEILDSDVYGNDTVDPSITVKVPTDHWLVIQAADGARPTIFSGLNFEGANGTVAAGALTLNGLLMLRGLTVTGPGGLLTIEHCTIIPRSSYDQRAIDMDTNSGDNVQLYIRSSIVGNMVLNPNADLLSIEDSIIDSAGYPHIGSYAGYAICGNGLGTETTPIPIPGPKTSIIRSTVFGKVNVQEVELISEAIITGTLVARRRQSGCIRFSYIPPGSRTPRRYYCQPDKAISDALYDKLLVPERVRPEFTSTTYGDPGYAQLSLRVATEIYTGAQDGSEMGVFSQLKQPQREANLRAGLDEAMRLGLEAGIFFAT